MTGFIAEKFLTSVMLCNKGNKQNIMATSLFHFAIDDCSDTNLFYGMPGTIFSVNAVQLDFSSHNCATQKVIKG